MENTVSVYVANELQDFTEKYVRQNRNIEIAIAALKEITDAPLPTLKNKYKLIVNTPFIGIDEEERDVIRKFIYFLETKEAPMGVIFRHFIPE